MRRRDSIWQLREPRNCIVMACLEESQGMLVVVPHSISKARSCPSLDSPVEQDGSCECLLSSFAFLIHCYLQNTTPCAPTYPNAKSILPYSPLSPDGLHKTHPSIGLVLEFQHSHSHPSPSAYFPPSPFSFP